jgi:prevent-host-death family protein
MSEGASRSRVGVRELRQNLSVYLRRVERGEALDVTEHGRVVARLSPAPAPGAGALERLTAEGRAMPPSRTLADVPPPVPSIGGATAALLELRQEER